MNMQLIFGIVINIITFSFFDTYTIEQFLFNFTDTGSFTSNFVAMGYPNMNAVTNMGLLFYFQIVAFSFYAMFGGMFLVKLACFRSQHNW